jgi:ABC-type polysaccharide/polyol phosphate export permease
VHVPAIARHAELIWFLTRDVLRKQFAGALLGLWWALLKPVCLVGVYSFVVLSVFRPSLESGLTPAGYLLLVLSGMGPWLLLAEPVAAAAGSIAANTPLLAKVLFPLEVLPVSRVLAAAISGAAAVLMLAAWLGVDGRLGLWAAAVPLVVLLQMLFVLGLGWAVAAATVTLPDVTHGLPFALNLWMLLSPVLYSPEMVPPDWSWLARANPMWPTIAVYRSLLLDNRAPDPVHLAVMGGWAAASLVIGYALFMQRRKMFADMI